MCGWAGAGNVGDELLTRAAAELIREAGGEPVIASRDPAATRATHGVDALRWGLVSRSALAGVDAVWVGPGGIIQDTSSLWSLPGHLLSAMRIRRRGGAVAGIGLGAEPLRRRTSAALLRRALAGAPVLCRDAASAAVVASAGVAASVEADLAFSLTLPPADPRDELAVAIGPAVRPGRVAPAARRLVRPDLDVVARVLDSQAAHLDVPISLLSFRGDRDTEMAAALAPRLRTPTTVVTGDVDEQVARLAGARAVVTSRYHALAVAAMSGTPALVVSEQAKLRALVDQVRPVVVAHRTRWGELDDVTLDDEPRSPVIPASGATSQVVADLVRAGARTPASASRG